MGDTINLVVGDLRACADRMAALAAENPEGAVYFPPKEGEESQPVELSGYVPFGAVVEHLRYFADMLEE